MFVRKMAMVILLGFAPMLMMASAAVSGDKIDIQTPGAKIDVLNGDKLLQAGDAKIKVKPGKRDDCLRIKAGNAKVKKGKIKHGECQR